MSAVDKAVVDFGAKMKRAREERGISLRQIAEVTKIAVSALEALERNDISRLPGGIFSRAFVRAYAVEIGLDPEQTVRDFLARFPDDSVTAGSRYVPQTYEDDSGDEPRRRRRSGVLIMVAVAALIIAAIVFAVGGP